ncbi:uncharacterized protein LOC106457824 isoform X2 [Limulus polyphemus]|nr:uncharacterized protein LOC106457824 isoform X2 [Limulus polyphemus]
MWSMVQVGGVTRDNTSDICQAPCSRSKHAMCATKGGLFYLLGGRSGNLALKDFWRFNPIQNEWERVRCHGNNPPCLQDHTIVAWKKQLYVFGGEVGFASTGETPLWVFDIETGVWKKQHARGMTISQPTGRRGHTAVIYHDVMYVYGGYQDLKGSSSELWSFDLGTEKWHLALLPNYLEQPPPCHDHSAVVQDGSMWVYGGMTDLLERSDFWRLDFETHQWSRVRAVKGPGELHGHSAVAFNNHMYIFGGERGGVIQDDLWSYDFLTETWERIMTEGITPQPRCSHVVVVNLQKEDLHKSNSQQSKVPTLGIQEKTPLPSHPPKSISMCFGQPSNDPEDKRRETKCKSHVVSRLCSKRTGAVDDEDSTVYITTYNPGTAQVNLRSLREKFQSSRLIRSISSGSYNILHHQGDNIRDELERLVEETPPPQQRPLARQSIQKSHSSDAVLESDSESSTPQHKLRPRSEALPFKDQSALFDEVVSNSPDNRCLRQLRTSQSVYQFCWTSDEKVTNGDSSAASHDTTFPQNVSSNKLVQGDLGYHGSQYTSTRTSRLIYEGPLSTVRDVEEENSEASVISEVDHQRISLEPAGDLLIEFEDPDHLESERPKSSGYTSCATLSDLTSQLCTPNVESRGFPHSVSQCSGYHSITEEEAIGKDSHREFAGCLNSAKSKKKPFRSREFPFELKMLNLIENPMSGLNVKQNVAAAGKGRSRSWDRASHRKDVVSYPLYSKTTTLSEPREKDKKKISLREVTKRDRQSKSPLKKWTVSGSPGRSRIEQHNWELCMYVFGGRERGATTVDRQPIPVWKLYV